MALIQDYHSKPSFTPVGKQTFTNCYMGVELEYEPKNPKQVGLLAERISDLLKDFIILKTDGSLKEGFEICSRPASLEVHRERWKEFFDSMTKDLQTFCFRDEKKFDEESHRLFFVKKRDDNCGMHVHINRENLSDLQIGKIVSFIHRKENHDFIKLIAERDSNSFCDYKYPRTIKDAKRERYIQLGRKLGVNLHSPSTIEIRIFRSPTKFKTFLKNLEFCEALVAFTTPGKNAIEDSSDYQKFIEFVKKYKKLWPVLFDFLTKNKDNLFAVDPKSFKEIKKKQNLFGPLLAALKFTNSHTHVNNNL